MAKAKSSGDPVLDELTSIKRLLVLMLVRSGATLSEIGAALGIDASNVSRMFPMPKKAKAGSKSSN